MNRNKKSIMAILLSFCMVLSLVLPVTVQAVNSTEDSAVQLLRRKKIHLMGLFPVQMNLKVEKQQIRQKAMCQMKTL